MSDDLRQRLENCHTASALMETVAAIMGEASSRIEELESLVEYAFREGVRAGLSSVPGSRAWEESGSYKKLKGNDDE